MLLITFIVNPNQSGTAKKRIDPLIRVSSYFVRNEKVCHWVEDSMEENVQFVRSQIDMAKRMNVIAIPSALVHGKVNLENTI